MIIDVIMPKMGESVNEGTVIKWYKQVGDKVKLDETIFEISTDKVDTEIPSPADGVLTEIIVKEQETVEAGAVVARISTEGEAVVTETAAAAVNAEPEKEEPKAEEEKETKPAIAAGQKTENSSSFFSPLVMNIAKAENISYQELEKITGTGQGGRVTKKDALEYLEKRNSQKNAFADQLAAAAKEPLPASKSVVKEAPQSGNDFEVIPMDNIRQKIMHYMTQSRDTAVHVSTVVEVDMSRIVKFIALKKEEYLKNEGVKLTYLSFIAEASVKALREFPLVNSAIEGTNIIRKKFVNLGIAVSLEPNGLIVPNIKRADEKSLIGLAKSITEMAYKSRNKKLVPDDISNGTFTITNYGVFGSLFGTPIINQPESAILGVGAVVKRAVVIEADGTDTIAIKPMMYLTLSHDHRLIDGMLGSNFLKSIKDSLENYSI
jgi:2-oxoglutarate dehydrogenase complex dihydrolipoamide succinyltransferase (E2) component